MIPKGKNSQKGVVIAAYLIAVVLSISALATASNFLLAKAVLIEPEEHWKYNVDVWDWDPEVRRNYGTIMPQLIIQNETQGVIEGYIADSNGTKLEFYQGEQIVMTRYAYDNGVASKWEMASKIIGGNFRIEIPYQHRDADTVRIYIGNNQYTVNDGTDLTPQTWVFVNSIRTDHRLDSTIQIQAETTAAGNASSSAAASEETAKSTVWNRYSEDSLIDRILRLYSSSYL